MVLNKLHEVEKNIKSRLKKIISTPKRLIRRTFKQEG